MRTNACYIGEKHEYDCDMDPQADPSQLHMCTEGPEQCRKKDTTPDSRVGRFKSALGIGGDQSYRREKKGSICGKGDYADYGVDCDYQKDRVRPQEGYCTRKASDCTVPPELTNRTGYRKQKAEGSIHKTGKKRVKKIDKAIATQRILRAGKRKTGRQPWGTLV